MQTLRIRTGAWLFVAGSLILLLTACSTLNTVVDPAPSASVLKPGTTVWNYQGASNILTAAWSPDGHFLAIGEAGGTVQVRDAMKGTVTLSLYGHTGAVWAVERIASGSWDTTVQVWQATTGQHLFTYRDHQDIIGAVAWSPDGTRIASAADDLRVWQVS